MKTLIRSLLVVSIPVLVFVFFQCNSEELVAPKQAPEHIISKDNPLPCCNDSNPNITGCEGSYYSLMCNGHDYPITCECCKELWNVYGSTSEGDLNYNGPPCPGDPGFLCSQHWRNPE